VSRSVAVIIAARKPNSNQFLFVATNFRRFLLLETATWGTAISFASLLDPFHPARCHPAGPLRFAQFMVAYKVDPDRLNARF
jgi:hypothetical protein